MSELKRDYWSDTLDCVTGKVKIDRREIAAIVETPYSPNMYPKTQIDGGNLEVHLKSGSIFTVTEWDVNTVANLYLVESPVEGVGRIPYRITTADYAIASDVYDESHTSITGKMLYGREEE
tara:strand:+ start:2045 stop:2407 length:363 start_codon:yes stop_codon:yes gene_type:complete